MPLLTFLFRFDETFVEMSYCHQLKLIVSETPDMTPWIAALSLAFITSINAQETAAPDAQAKFLAGLPVEGTPLAALAEEGSWKTHAKEFSKAWGSLEQKQLSKIRDWAPKALGADVAGPDHLIYFFSGPDALYANTFFPNATTYVLCGLEPVGTPPDVAKLPKESLGASLSNLRKSLDAVLSFSFFKTKDMKNDLTATQLTGTIPVLYVFLERLGNTIKSVELVDVDAEGSPITEGKGSAHGAKITFAKEGGPTQTLYYFSTDISDEGIKNKPGFIKFCDKLGKGNAFLKAASYLLHESYFSTARDFLLTHAKTVVQDDSGIPVKHFNASVWDVHYHGHYAGPIDMFKNRYQDDLAASMKSKDIPALPFSFGYRWHSNESSLISATATKPVPKAIPVKE